MERRLGAESEPAVPVTERESRSFRRVQGGDAAKAAEQSEREPSGYRGTFGINLRTTRGAKFELEKHPVDPGEASPVPAADSGGQNTLAVPSQAQTEESSTGVTKKLFRKLFHP